MKFPCEIEVRTYVSAPGRSSFEMCQEIRCTDQSGVLMASGGAKVVWVNFPLETPAPLPECVRALLPASQA